jgi:hypothetical protein
MRVALALVITVTLACCDSESGVAALPECVPSVEDRGELTVNAVGDVDRTDLDHQLAVVEASRERLVLQEDTVQYEEDVEVVIRMPDPLPGGASFPAVGEQVLVRGGNCDLSGDGYFRIASLAGDLLWEGGNPGCTLVRDTYSVFGMQPAKEEDRCREPPRRREGEGCCCITRINWDVTVDVAGEPEVLADGESRVVTIEDHQYAAYAYFSYQSFDGPCSYDAALIHGSAYLVRLED